MIRQAYIFQVNTAVGDGKLLMNRIIPQEVDVLFVQVRNGKEQGYDSAHAAYHQQCKGNKPPLVFSVIQNLHLNRCRLFVDCCFFLVAYHTASQIGEFMQAEQVRNLLQEL